jgi:hypothetical protein
MLRLQRWGGKNGEEAQQFSFWRRRGIPGGMKK